MPDQCVRGRCLLTLSPVCSEHRSNHGLNAAARADRCAVGVVVESQVAQRRATILLHTRRPAVRAHRSNHGLDAATRADRCLVGVVVESQVVQRPATLRSKSVRTNSLD